MTGNASGRKPLNLAATQGGASGRQEKLPAALLFTDTLPDDLVEVGYVGAAYGIRGWIKVQPHADDASALLHARRWWLLRAPPAGVVSAPAQSAEAVSIKISQSREHSGTVVAQPAGVSDRSVAEMLKGRRVWVRRADFPAAEEGEFYWVDLIGCAVVNEQGEALGEVTGLIDNGAHQILQVAYELPDGKAAERLIPFVDAFLRTVDTPARRIVVDWGLDY
ncbi:16S rRNA processing protein RimM [Cupriavidus metallidurans]|uniref:ribosome maturation factor RimM n=1 Tax=Cupriavidus TaxID=106589 RepID=UPI0004931725|nr:ribosome maturation factor RimM [Cupriavidus metallidurans]MDE4917065.1 ribosome maturation factor RimM [Cupriavidus metallidurans]UBM11783.1 ribosome maturation factor RimM [Cupriavidus metallidurans]